MEKNGWRPENVRYGITLEAAEPSQTNDECDTNQIIIGYIPALFYSNMFSLAFLEIKSLTKISDTKS